MNIPPKQFVSQLVTNKIIDQVSADKYEIESLTKNLPIDEYLLKFTSVARNEILKIKATFLEVPSIDIMTTAVDPQAINLINETISSRYVILPYSYDAKTETLYIATGNPLDINLMSFLEKKTGKKIVLTLAF